MEEEDREEDVLRLDGTLILAAPSAPEEPDGGGGELSAARPAPRDRGAGAEERLPQTGTRKDRLPEAPAAAETDWRGPAADAARAALERARRWDAAEPPGREDGETRASIFWPEKVEPVFRPEEVEPVFRQDGADRSLTGARAVWRGGSLPGNTGRLLGGGADGLSRGGTDGPGPARAPAEGPGGAELTGLEGAAWSGSVALPGRSNRDMAGLEALYRQTARAVRLEASLPGGGAQTVVRAEEAAPAAALTVEELDRAVRRDSRRYDGSLEIY